MPSSEPVGVFDIGSNSVRLVVYERLGRNLTPLFNEKALCGLGREVATKGRLAPDAVEKALAALARFRALCDVMQVGEAIARVGLFDKEAFPKGYGEETDYCFRATDAGLSLVVATHTYVFHAKSKSYGTARTNLTREGTETLRRTYGRGRLDRAAKTMELHPLLVQLRHRFETVYAEAASADEAPPAA